jgi:hypothetical protein
MPRDRHYTPSEIADLMAAAVPSGFSPHVVADFAVGRGSLLEATHRRWPTALHVANDAHRASAQLVQRRKPDWIVCNADFLHPQSRTRSKLFALFGAIDLVLLNPPFSQRGVKPIPLSINGVDTHCGMATAFVCRSVTFLAPDGHLVAVLPKGSLFSERDRQAWDLLRAHWLVDDVADLGSFAFSGVTASARVLRISHTTKESPARAAVPAGVVPNWLVRGQCQMHTVADRLSRCGLPLVHSTNLRGGNTVLDGTQRVRHPNSVMGPLVLFPRVGQISSGKICVLPKQERVVLSDCVMAILTTSTSGANDVRKKMVSSLPSLSAMYGGTGAPYITLQRAGPFLISLGVEAFSRKLD